MLNRNNILDQNWVSIEIIYSDLDNLLLQIPRKPGLYEIRTNTPKNVLESFSARNDENHYNFNRKITLSNTLPESYKISQNKNNPYTIYNGHHAILRQRASEHFKGSRGTSCLAVFELEFLRDYIWFFRYLDLSEIENYNDNKLLRTYLEQMHRSKIGWPILCSE